MSLESLLLGDDDFNKTFCGFVLLLCLLDTNDPHLAARLRLVCSRFRHRLPIITATRLRWPLLFSNETDLREQQWAIFLQMKTHFVEEDGTEHASEHYSTLDVLSWMAVWSALVDAENCAVGNGYLAQAMEITEHDILTNLKLLSLPGRFHLQGDVWEASDRQEVFAGLYSDICTSLELPFDWDAPPSLPARVLSPSLLPRQLCGVFQDTDLAVSPAELGRFTEHGESGLARTTLTKTRELLRIMTPRSPAEREGDEQANDEQHTPVSAAFLKPTDTTKKPTFSFLARTPSPILSTPSPPPPPPPPVKEQPAISVHSDSIRESVVALTPSVLVKADTPSSISEDTSELPSPQALTPSPAPSPRVTAKRVHIPFIWSDDFSAAFRLPQIPLSRSIANSPLWTPAPLHSPDRTAVLSRSIRESLAKSLCASSKRYTSHSPYEPSSPDASVSPASSLHGTHRAWCGVHMANGHDRLVPPASLPKSQQVEITSGVEITRAAPVTTTRSGRSDLEGAASLVGVGRWGPAWCGDRPKKRSAGVHRWRVPGQVGPAYAELSFASPRNTHMAHTPKEYRNWKSLISPRLSYATASTSFCESSPVDIPAVVVTRSEQSPPPPSAAAGATSKAIPEVIASHSLDYIPHSPLAHWTPYGSPNDHSLPATPPLSRPSTGRGTARTAHAATHDAAASPSRVASPGGGARCGAGGSLARSHSLDRAPTTCVAPASGVCGGGGGGDGDSLDLSHGSARRSSRSPRSRDVAREGRDGGSARVTTRASAGGGGVDSATSGAASAGGGGVDSATSGAAGAGVGGADSAASGVAVCVRDSESRDSVSSHTLDGDSLLSLTSRGGSSHAEWGAREEGRSSEAWGTVGDGRNSYDAWQRADVTPASCLEEFSMSVRVVARVTPPSSADVVAAGLATTTTTTTTTMTASARTTTTTTTTRVSSTEATPTPPRTPPTTAAAACTGTTPPLAHSSTSATATTGTRAYAAATQGPTAATAATATATTARTTGTPTQNTPPAAARAATNTTTVTPNTTTTTPSAATNTATTTPRGDHTPRSPHTGRPSQIVPISPRPATMATLTARPVPVLVSAPNLISGQKLSPTAVRPTPPNGVHGGQGKYVGRRRGSKNQDG